MRSETTGVSGRCVEHKMIGRWFASIRHDDRRILVPCAEDNPECLELADLCCLDDVSHLVPRCLADQTLFFERGADKLIGRRTEIDNGFGDRSLMHLASFVLIGREQAFATPPRQPRGHLPSKINGVAYPHVHAEPAEWRVQMTGVAREEYSDAREPDRDETKGPPQV